MTALCLAGQSRRFERACAKRRISSSRKSSGGITASIAVMGPQAAINAVYYNQLQAIEDPDERAKRTEQLRAEYAADVDILHLASEIVIDAVVQPDDLRTELIRRYATAAAKRRDWPEKRNPVTPV